MPGRKDIPFFKRLLAWIASLKYNVLFLEVGGGIEYKRRPEINRAWEKFCAEADAQWSSRPRLLRSPAESR